MSTVDDSQLATWIRQCATGDQHAFRALATALGGRMFALAYRLMGDDATTAEDAVQDALIKIWVNAPRYQPTGRVASWVSTIVHHCCMDLHRKAKPHVELDPETEWDQMSATQNLYNQERKQKLAAGLHGLPERQRRAVLLSYFGDNSNQQIARMLNVSEGAVESLLVRARRTLARTLPAEFKEGGWS